MYDASVDTVALDKILQLIDEAEGRERSAHVAPPGLPASPGAPVTLPLRQAHDLFLLAFVRLADAFGRPDHPSEEGDHAHPLAMDTAALAVWDFDGYHLVLALSPEASGATVVVSIRPPL